jgi:type I restriction enzyme, S subunit
VKAWPRVRLGEVLFPVERAELVDPAHEYRTLGVRWYGGGLFEKDRLIGQEIKAARVYRVEQGDFVYNRLFAWKGSFAFAGPEVHGAYVSNEFPCFAANADKILPEFLRWWFMQKKTWLASLGLSSGATPTSRNRLKEEHFLGLEIPLPALAEQRRIVDRIEALVGQARCAQELAAQAATARDSLLVSMAHRADLSPDEKLGAGWRWLRLGDVVRLTSDPEKVVVSQHYPNFGIYGFGRGLFAKPPIDGASTSASVLYRVRSGQFVYSRLFAFEGAYGYVTTEFDGCFVSNEYPTFDCSDADVLSEFLSAYFKRPSIWKELSVGSKGLGDRRQRVQPQQILQHQIWLPPIRKQRELAEALRNVGRSEQLAADIESELAALTPTVLNKAFAGQI